MKCPHCQTENPPQAKFCLECATPLAQTCVNCGTKLPPAAKFCPECAHPAGARAATQARFASPDVYTPKHLAEKILTSKSALEGERKQVTVLFCDLANSTALAERLGPEAMHGLLNQFFELALAEVHRYEGTINQFLGDGFMALFGAPLAHEDHARRAVLAALGIQRTLREHHADLGVPPGAELVLRMGLNTGPVVVGKIGDNLRMDYTAVGDTTNLAARLQQLAEPGAIYLSESTHRLTEGYVECQSLGEQRIKGKAEPVTVYRLLGARAHPGSVREPEVGRISSPLVGREREVAALSGCLERLLAGWGGIVGVIGEAGLGKSRLVTEVSRQVAARNLLWLEGRALSFGQTLSYWPFLEILRRWAGITEDDGEAESWTKLERGVRALFPDEVAEVLPYLATWLGVTVREEFQGRIKYLDGEAMGRQIFRTARRFFERLARERPLVLVFEDLHWTDQSSTELVEHLFPLVESVPLLLVGVGRPERQSAAARLRAAAGRTYPARYTEVALAPLAPDDSAQLVQNLLASDALPPRLGELVLQKAEGNPFFVEEVMRALIDMGALVRDRVTGAWRATRPVEQLAIPDTLEAVILARVDRLEEEVKQLLRVASVIGRSFFYRVLRALAEAERRLDQDLTELQDLELIREKRRRPELEYIFKHALIQEATYGSILVDRRRDLHRRVGECIETLFADRLDEFSGLLAYHYARAEAWEKAQAYLFRAGDQAGRIAADSEALAHYRQALTAYERVFGERWDPLQRAILERKMGEALFRRGDHQQALEYLQRALALLGSPLPTSRGDIRLAVLRQLVQQFGHRLAPRLLVRPTAPRSDPAVEETDHLYELIGSIDIFLVPERFVLEALGALNFSERAGYGVGVARGFVGMGLVCDLIPAFGLAGYYHRRAVALADQIQHPVTVGFAHFGLAIHEECVGNWDSALEHYQRGAAVFKDAGHLRGWGACRCQVGWLCVLRGEFARSRESAQELIRAGQEASDRQVSAWGLFIQGLVERCTGFLDEAVVHLQASFELARAIPNYWNVAQAGGFLGQCYLRQGKLKQALLVLDEANQIVAERGVRLPVASRPALAEAHLVAADEAQGAERAEILKKAKRACQAAQRQCRLARGALPIALRMQGTYRWLRDEPTAARKWWQRSLAVAAELGARYDLGLTYLEMGRRLGTPEHLQRAEAIFAEIGATLDLAQARDLLNQSAM